MIRWSVSTVVTAALRKSPSPLNGCSEAIALHPCRTAGGAFAFSFAFTALFFATHCAHYFRAGAAARDRARSLVLWLREHSLSSRGRCCCSGLRTSRTSTTSVRRRRSSYGSFCSKRQAIPRPLYCGRQCTAGSRVLEGAPWELSQRGKPLHTDYRLWIECERTVQGAVVSYHDPHVDRIGPTRHHSKLAGSEVLPLPLPLPPLIAAHSPSGAVTCARTSTRSLTLCIC